MELSLLVRTSLFAWNSSSDIAIAHQSTNQCGAEPYRFHHHDIRSLVSRSIAASRNPTRSYTPFGTLAALSTWIMRNG